VLTIYFKDGKTTTLDRSWLSVVYNDHRVVKIEDHVSGRVYRFNR